MSLAWEGLKAKAEKKQQSAGRKIQSTGNSRTGRQCIRFSRRKREKTPWKRERVFVWPCRYLKLGKKRRYGTGQGWCECCEAGKKRRDGAGPGWCEWTKAGAGCVWGGVLGTGNSKQTPLHIQKHHNIARKDLETAEQFKMTNLKV